MALVALMKPVIFWWQPSISSRASKSVGRSCNGRTVNETRVDDSVKAEVEHAQ